MSNLIAHVFEGGTQEQYDAIGALRALGHPMPPPQERTAEVTNQVGA